MVKYLSFHNSSFALRYVLKCKWQGQSATHPLFVKLEIKLGIDVGLILVQNQCWGFILKLSTIKGQSCGTPPLFLKIESS
jgi:hypothetical protein